MTAKTCTDFVAIIADMHLTPKGAPADRKMTLKDSPARRASHLEAILRQIEAGPRPAAVLFGGDNTNHPWLRPGYGAAATEFMRRFPEPVRAIAGNHDVGSTVGWAHHSAAEMGAAREVFCRDWQDRWMLDAAGFRILGINSQIFGSGLPAEADQAAWLRDMLARPTELLRIVFAHTPPYLKMPADAFDDGSEQMCLKPPARKSLLGILGNAPPDLLVTAHCHRFWVCNQPDWDWLGMPASGFGQDEMQDLLGVPASGFGQDEMQDLLGVPSHNLPQGIDRVGWAALRRDGGGWGAEFHPVDNDEAS